MAAINTLGPYTIKFSDVTHPNVPLLEGRRGLSQAQALANHTEGGVGTAWFSTAYKTAFKLHKYSAIFKLPPENTC